MSALFNLILVMANWPSSTIMNINHDHHLMRRNAGRRRDWEELTLVSTLSPCIMCTGATLLYKIKRCSLLVMMNTYHAQSGGWGERQLLLFCRGCDGLSGGSSSSASGERHFQSGLAGVAWLSDSATETLSPFVERVLAIFCNKSINF